MRQCRPAVAELGLTPAKVYRELGYGRETPDEPIRELTVALLDRVKHLARPCGTYQFHEGRVGADAVELDEGTVLPVGEALAGVLSGCHRFAVFAATAGDAYRELRGGWRADPVADYVLDGIGTCIVMAVGKRLEQQIAAEVPGFRHGSRISPGYCGWPLPSQRDIFRLLGGELCGIALTPSCLMQPLKSISGIVGIGRDIRPGGYGCTWCSLDNCSRRRGRRHGRFDSAADHGTDRERTGQPGSRPG